MKTALVLGSSGQIGAAVCDALLGDGWKVFAATRSGRPPPRHLLAKGAAPIDAGNKPLDAILDEAGRPVDAVIDPLAFDEKDARALSAAAGRFAAAVVLSSASVYADDEGRTLDEARQHGFPIFDRPRREDDPIVKPGAETYSTRKVAMERVLAEAPAPVTILRPCAIYGRYGRHPREWWLLKRGLDRRPAIPVAYNAESVFHTTSAKGLAELIGLCLEKPEAAILNAGDPEALSVARIAEAIASETGLSLPLAPFDGPPPENHVGSTPWSIPSPFTVDSGKAETLGWKRGGYRDEVGKVCNWMIDAAEHSDWKAVFTVFGDYGYDPFDYAAEDEFQARR